MRLVAEQLAAEYDVEPGDAYDEQVVQIETQARAARARASATAVVDPPAGGPVRRGRADRGRRTAARGRGLDGRAARAQLARGQEAFADWIDENGVDIDPQFGVELDNGQVTPVDTSLSVPVGDSAKAAAKRRRAGPGRTPPRCPAAHTLRLTTHG